jgi:hypothetical protein
MLKMHKGNGKFSKYGPLSGKEAAQKHATDRKQINKDREGRPPLYLDPQKQI